MVLHANLKGAIGEEAERVFSALRPAGIEEAHLRRVLRHLVREGEGQITATPAALSDFPVDTPERLHHERGLGVPLMRTLADEVEFRAEGGGTTVRLVLRDREAVAS